MTPVTIPRRAFLAYGLATGWAVSWASAESPAPKRNPGLPVVNALSPLKKKLADEQSATLLLISDSTGYRDTSGTRRFIRWLASQFPSHSVMEWYWAEWETRAPTELFAWHLCLAKAEGLIVQPPDVK